MRRNELSLNCKWFETERRYRYVLVQRNEICPRTDSNGNIASYISIPSQRRMSADCLCGRDTTAVHATSVSCNSHLFTPHIIFTVSDFTETLAQLYEKHAEELQVLVSNYRKKNGELRKEVSWKHFMQIAADKAENLYSLNVLQRPPCQSSLFHAWETFLQEVEADSQSTSELSNLLSKQVSRSAFGSWSHRYRRPKIAPRLIPIRVASLKLRPSIILNYN